MECSLRRITQAGFPVMLAALNHPVEFAILLSIGRGRKCSRPEPLRRSRTPAVAYNDLVGGKCARKMVWFIAQPNAHATGAHYPRQLALTPPTQAVPQASPRCRRLGPVHSSNPRRLIADTSPRLWWDVQPKDDRPSYLAGRSK
jgi:hypothetical protein